METEPIRGRERRAPRLLNKDREIEQEETDQH